MQIWSTGTTNPHTKYSTPTCPDDTTPADIDPIVNDPMFGLNTSSNFYMFGVPILRTDVAADGVTPAYYYTYDLYQVAYIGSDTFTLTDLQNHFKAMFPKFVVRHYSNVRYVYDAVNIP